tara:strand:+ start:1158 stop:1313 length:156 start_codon:yes stop_codon:yes gene_type:complete
MARGCGAGIPPSARYRTASGLSKEEKRKEKERKGKDPLKGPFKLSILEIII